MPLLWGVTLSAAHQQALEAISVPEQGMLYSLFKRPLSQRTVFEAAAYHRGEASR